MYSFFPMNTGVKHSCVLAPLLFNTCMDWVLRVVDQSPCGTSIANNRITDLVFANDAVILAVTGNSGDGLGRGGHNAEYSLTVLTCPCRL